MAISILVPLNDSVSSKSVVDFLVRMSLCPEDFHVTLVHVFRKPTSGEELMGKKFMESQPERLKFILQTAKERMVKEAGFNPAHIDLAFLTDPYASVTEGIIDFCKKGNYDMIVLGRKKMSKAEEFVLGDISIKLIRSLDHTHVLVVKSK